VFGESFVERPVSNRLRHRPEKSRDNEKIKREKGGDKLMKKLSLVATLLFLTGCTTITVSETEACFQISQKSDQVLLSRSDHPETIQSVGELLFMIEEVCPRG